MFFVLAKILGFFALPSNILISLGLVSVMLMATRFARAGRRLVMTGGQVRELFGREQRPAVRAPNLPAAAVQLHHAIG